MRISREESYALTRPQLITTLREGSKAIAGIEQLMLKSAQIDNEINNAQAQYSAILNGFSNRTLLIIFIVSGVLLWILSKSFLLGLVVGAALTLGAKFGYQKLFANQLKAKADAFAEQNIAPLNQQKATVEKNTQLLADTDAFYNVVQLLPAEYLSSEATTSMVSLLETNRAGTLGEAINFYEEYLHRQRMEDYEQQKLEAAREATQAQIRIAQLQEQAIREQRQNARAMQNKMDTMISEQRRTTLAAEDAANEARLQRRLGAQVQKSAAGGSGKTVKCRNCKQPINPRALQCPYCGKSTDYSSTFGGIFESWMNK